MTEAERLIASLLCKSPGEAWEGFMGDQAPGEFWRLMVERGARSYRAACEGYVREMPEMCPEWAGLAANREARQYVSALLERYLSDNLGPERFDREVILWEALLHRPVIRGLHLHPANACLSLWQLPDAERPYQVRGEVAVWVSGQWRTTGEPLNYPVADFREARRQLWDLRDYYSDRLGYLRAGERDLRRRPVLPAGLDLIPLRELLPVVAGLSRFDAEEYRERFTEAGFVHLPEVCGCCDPDSVHVPNRCGWFRRVGGVAW